MSRNEADAATRHDASGQGPERRFQGIAVSPGIGIGPVFGSREAVAIATRHRIQAADIVAELARLDSGIAQGLKQLGRLKTRLGVLPEDAQSELAPLIDAYRHMLGPSRLTRGIRRRISETLVSAETAVMEETEAIASLMLRVQDSPTSEDSGDDNRASQVRRAEEVREVGRRLVRNLTGTAIRNFADLPVGAVVFSEALRPADAALLDPVKIAGVAAEEGGGDGHTAIMLRALGLPSVLGAPGLGQWLHSGDIAIIDGSRGIITLNPGAETLAQARADALVQARERQKLARLRRLPAETLDREVMQLQANIELPAELPLITRAGASGIGLLRTEFLFMNRETMPDEATQEAVYRQIIDAMGGDPVTIRVLDWGGEKEIEALSSAGLVSDVKDTNPALGLRGIRLLLRQPALLETQLTAILRAAAAGPVRIMVPMVTCVDEMRDARRVYERVVQHMRRDLEALPPYLPSFGAMVETPGAALTADALAEEADFLAIGTNDLTMYTLAVDRAEGAVNGLYDPLHPAVLRLVQFTVEAGRRMGKPVSVCGEIAGDPRYVPLLMGLGVREFSMSAASLPRVKQRVRAVRLEDCQRLAQDVMAANRVEQIRELIGRFDADLPE